MSFAGLFAVILGCALLVAGRHRPADAAPPPAAGRRSRRPRADGGRRRRRLALAHRGRHRRPGDRGLGDGRDRRDDRQLPADGGALAGDDAAVGRLRHRGQPGGRASAARTSIRRWPPGRWRCRGSREGTPSAASSSPPPPGRSASWRSAPTERSLARTFELKEGQPRRGLAGVPGAATRCSSPSPSPPAPASAPARTLRLRTARGDRDFRVMGVYYDYASDQGVRADEPGDLSAPLERPLPLRLRARPRARGRSRPRGRAAAGARSAPGGRCRSSRTGR